MIEGNLDNFEKEVLKSEKPVLVDFNATWCGPCQAMAMILDPLARSNKDFKIVSVDIDENPELAKEYNVMTIPCLVVFEDGKEKTRDTGLTSEKRILKLVGKK